MSDSSSHGKSSQVRVKAYLLESAEVKRQASVTCLAAIERAVDVIAASLKSGNKVLLCGNGGSAADCQHMAAELLGGLSKYSPRTGFSAVALTTDSSFMTAYANDWGFERVFERQVQALGRPNDVLIAISTSGNSPNILAAVNAARALRMQTIALTGGAGRLAASADVVISVPSSHTQHIQEVHLAIEHIICELVEEAVASD